MRILLVGSGAREHAFAHALARSSVRPELIAAPGNPGIGALAENVKVRADDVDALVRLARDRAVDLVVVGPELPLVLGLADVLEREGIPVFGPSASAARLEGSKAFAKDFMVRHGIATAAYRTFTSAQHEDAVQFVRQQGAPIVVKASGLAAGKGAVVCATEDEALSALESMMRSRDFGEAGDYVVVESFMDGEEASLFAVCDGRDYVMLASAQDHKRIGDEDTGPNTGGMGAYAPAPVVTDAVMEEARRLVIEPTLRGMASDGTPYRGILYVGLMIGADGLRVVEYNCRMGDPEAQVVLPLLRSDAVDLFYRAATGRLAGYDPGPVEGAAAAVVLAAAGYPGPYARGVLIRGIPEAEAGEGVVIFHAGTSKAEGLATGGGGVSDDDLATAGGGVRDDDLVTAGGRVLTVSAIGVDLPEALARAYGSVSKVHFDGVQYRRDIGRKGLLRLGFGT